MFACAWSNTPPAGARSHLPVIDIQSVSATMSALVLTTIGRGGSSMASSTSTPRHVHVAGELRQRIIRRDYRIGESLPTESTLCAEFGVSRGPVRQALATLKNEGLIRLSQGKPAVVRSHDATQTLDTFTPVHPVGAS